MVTVEVPDSIDETQKQFSPVRHIDFHDTPSDALPPCFPGCNCPPKKGQVHEQPQKTSPTLPEGANQAANAAPAAAPASNPEAANTAGTPSPMNRLSTIEYAPKPPAHERKEKPETNENNAVENNENDNVSEEMYSVSVAPPVPPNPYWKFLVFSIFSWKFLDLRVSLLYGKFP